MPVTLATGINDAARWIRSGGVVAYPTESCFGLGCDPQNITAISRILEMKRRSRDKGLILIADRIERLLPYLGDLDNRLLARLQASWPGPFTWLCPASSLASNWLTGAHDSLAVRVTAHPPAARLSRDCGMPLVSTSANLAGQPALRSAKAVRHAFGTAIDFVLDQPIGCSDRPSTIMDVVSGEVLRS